MTSSRNNARWFGMLSMGTVFLIAVLVASCAPAVAAKPAVSLSPAPTAAATAPATASPSLPDETPAPGGSFDDGVPPPSFTEPPIDLGTLPLSCDPSLVPEAAPQPSHGAPVDPRLRLHVPILEYHRIVPYSLAGRSLRSLVVPPSTFDQQMHALAAAGWHTITAGQLGYDLVEGIQPPHKTFVVTFDDGWWDGYGYAFPILQKYGFVGTFYVITSRLNQSDGMSALEWQVLVAAGDEIGDHTVSHLPLARLSYSSARVQIIRSAQTIADVTGQWPESLSYPYGSFDPTAISILQSCDPFMLAVTTMQGVGNTWATRFEAPRIKVESGTTAADLLRRLDPYQ
jgi:peptidoglycan/xylan/chitin deacetylase (PgdA/CDA1 family)